MSFDSEQQSLNETCNLAASAVFKAAYPCSLLQYFVDSIMVCGEYKAIVVDEDTMDQLKAVNINTSVPKDDYSQLYVPLISSHMIPGTEFKFMLEFYDSQLVYLRTIETGKR